MAWTLVASISAAGQTIATTAAVATIDTTGADLLVISVGWGSFGPTPTLTDSKGNTWLLALQRASPSGVSERIYYAKSPTVGVGHTFTFSAGGPAIYASLIVHAFAGADLTAPLDSPTNSAATGSGTSLATGTITPSVNGALVVSGFAHNQATAPTANAGLTLTHHAYLAGGYMGTSLGWLAQATAAAINPTWSWTGSSEGATVIVAFKPPAAPVSIETAAPFLILPV